MELAPTLPASRFRSPAPLSSNSSSAHPERQADAPTYHPRCDVMPLVSVHPLRHGTHIDRCTPLVEVVLYEERWALPPPWPHSLHTTPSRTRIAAGPRSAHGCTAAHIRTRGSSRPRAVIDAAPAPHNDVARGRCRYASRSPSRRASTSIRAGPYVRAAEAVRPGSAPSHPSGLQPGHSIPRISDPQGTRRPVSVHVVVACRSRLRFRVGSLSLRRPSYLLPATPCQGLTPPDLALSAFYVRDSGCCQVTEARVPFPRPKRDSWARGSRRSNLNDYAVGGGIHCISEAASRPCRRPPLCGDVHSVAWTHGRSLRPEGATCDRSLPRRSAVTSNERSLSVRGRARQPRLASVGLRCISATSRVVV
ncbi:uncharacterized protein B0H18DRAFT_1042875 [Fomitopsis serialis]|uniref:uncharacterized protein n=1 Tax=Fomitopsis serialis TaxID=139415 RepID=UPI00200814CE|nr:uncharacterized protein B0H18DRAFT_1042875 [Neoantrodia serialis]KAH9915091.1 hypothetical protein B0H18DRAFT_1042875 [Neoantrodia serialis]